VNQPDFIQTESAQASARTSRFKGHAAGASGPAAPGRVGAGGHGNAARLATARAAGGPALGARARELLRPLNRPPAPAVKPPSRPPQPSAFLWEAELGRRPLPLSRGRVGGSWPRRSPAVPGNRVRASPGPRPLRSWRQRGAGP